ncbi:MAG: alpha/beta fold hydrolase [Planctomycetia bacterium]|nr:alpha/beta fold hydrolase [Planctomycetia bacterium]
MPVRYHTSPESLLRPLRIALIAAVFVPLVGSEAGLAQDWPGGNPDRNWSSSSLAQTAAAQRPATDQAPAETPKPATKPAPKPAPPTTPPPTTKKPKVELPPPEPVDMLTRDGVRLKTTFFPGTKGKETAPVILLHMFKGSRNDYRGLAPYLQAQGHAVLVPDLRGHGDSTALRDSTKTLDADTMPRASFLGMVAGDMEECKKFLMGKNNKGELNINKLCIVGAEMGAIVAADYARLDWSWPALATGKQGQDVRALVLISPQWSSHGLQMKDAMASPAVRGGISVMLVVGKENSQDLREASRLNGIFRRYHPDADAEKPSDRTLFYLTLPTKLQGTKILDIPALQLGEGIAMFIKLRLVDQSFAWQERGGLP